MSALKSLPPCQRTLIQRSRKLVTGQLKINLHDRELVALIGHLIADLAPGASPQFLPESAKPMQPYYETPLMNRQLSEVEIREVNLPGLFLEAMEIIPDFGRAFESLCEIHKRRLKFARIREEQTLPDVTDLAPRGMLMSGFSSATALAASLKVGKHVYDIDNRAAQEAAYLFMKVIANGMGGSYCSGVRSPVRRSTGDRKRRPVDILIDRKAYDFKCRMTEAASRRARFDDELMFPRDCYASGYQPVLLALHQLPGDRTEALVEAYARYDGETYIGSDAWDHVSQHAGPTMARFLDIYVLDRINQVIEADEGPVEMTVRLSDGYVEYVVTGSDGVVETVRFNRA